MNDTKPLLELRGARAIIGNKVKIYPSFPLVTLKLYEDKLSVGIWPAWTHEILLKDIEAVILVRRLFFCISRQLRYSIIAQPLRTSSSSARRLLV